MKCEVCLVCVDSQRGPDGNNSESLPFLVWSSHFMIEVLVSFKGKFEWDFVWLPPNVNDTYSTDGQFSIVRLYKFCKSDEFNYCSFRMEFVVLHTVKNIFPYGLLCELCSSNTALKILLCFIRPLLLQAGFCYGLMKTRWHVSVVILILIMASTFAPSGQGSSLSVLWICAWMNVRISIVLCTQ